jgi:putative pyruvate formate lyase activating enzyme
VSSELDLSPQALRACALCPRRCGADRVAGRLGYCRSGAQFGIGSICVHRGEEPVLVGAKGICNVFFTRCNLQCVYCQNYQISRNTGEIEEHLLDLPGVLARIERSLDAGVRRVGFVSPSHCIPQMMQIIRALEGRRPRPVFVYNTNAYDRVETLRALDGVIDVYLPDLKYMDSALAARLSDAPDYPAVAAAALREIFRQKGSRIGLDAAGGIESGLILRHLVLPGHVENSLECLRFIAGELSAGVHLSLLAQYRPLPSLAGDAELGRSLRREEYDAVLAELDRLGFYRGWTQEPASVEFYSPDFQREHPFE